MRATPARTPGAGVAFVFLLLGALLAPRAHAMAVPDSAGFARLAKTAGRSGRADLRVLWQHEWYTLRKASYDSSGVHGGARERDTKGMTAVWAEPAPQGDIAWADVERLQVPNGQRRSAAPIVGAVLGASVGSSAAAYASVGSHVDPMAVVAVIGLSALFGAVEGAVFDGLIPFKKPRWVEF
jgi:hypothetical protein